MLKTGAMVPAVRIARRKGRGLARRRSGEVSAEHGQQPVDLLLRVVVGEADAHDAARLV